MNLNPFALKDELAIEAHELVDKYLRKLPKNSDGSINSSAEGFQDNDVDALRHAYVSGVFAQEYGATTADIFGRMNEFFPGYGTSAPNAERSINMDLWNNAVGRKYGKKIKNRLPLFKELLKALNNGCY